MQGFTVTDSDLVFYSSNAGNPEYGLLFGYTGDNLATAKSGTPKYIAGGHGNDMTFNPNTNEVLLTGPDGYNEIWRFDADDLSYNGSIATGSSNMVGLNFGSIGYDRDDNLYIGGSGNTVYSMDAGFNQVKNSIDIPNNSIGQGLEFHKGYVFKTSWTDYECTGHLYCSEDETGSSTIEVYNAKYNTDGSTSKNFGRHVATIFVGENSNFGELETIAFRNDDVYLGYAAQWYDTDYTYKFYHFPYSTLAINLDATVSYADTAGAITVTISSGDQLTPITGYTLSQDGYSMSKTVHSESISEVVQVCDRYSNCSNVTVSHSNTSYKQNQTVSFSSGHINKTYGDANFTNAATTDGDGTISYTSDNTAVAEVNSTTGEVTIIGAGTANITATASSTETYFEGTASYALSVAKATSLRPSEIEDILIGNIGEPLSSITFMTTGIYWADDSAIILPSENEYQVHYTQNNDTNNYTTETFTATVRGVVRVYLVLEGDQQVYTKGESEVASFRIDADFSLFEEYGSIYIDEQLLSSDSYRAEKTYS